MIMYKGLVETYCPYYIREAECSITCEGIVASALSCLKFDSSQKKEQFQRKSCFLKDYYKNCPIAAFLESEYSNNKK